MNKYPGLVALERSRDFSAIRLSSIAVHGESHITYLSRCASALVKELPRGRLEAFVDEDTKQKLPEELLDEANHLHKTLTQYWPCECLVRSRLVSLNLSIMDRTPGTDEHLSFSLLFACSDTHRKWQEGEISVRIPRYDFFFFFIAVECEDRETYKVS